MRHLTVKQRFIVFGIPLLAAIVGVGLGWMLWGPHRSADASPTPSASASPSPSSSLSAAPGTPVPACEAELTVTNSWEGGWQGDVTVTALANIEDWEVNLDLGDTKVTGAWNSTLAVGASGLAPAGNVDYNGIVASGASTAFGFTADGEAPTSPTASCWTTTQVVLGAAGDASGSTAGTPGDYVIRAGVDSPTGDDWLSTSGNRIVNAQGKAVWITGANWFGFNTQERVFHGLYAGNLEDMLTDIATHGINTIRVPISTELLLEWRDGKAATTSAVNASANPALADKTTLEIFDVFLGAAKDRGLKVILDVHSAEADNMGHMTPVWWAGSVTTEDFYAAWEWVAARYAKDDTIIGFDLKNEPHGTPSESPRAKWDGSSDADNWRHVAHTATARIQAVHPNALILVEGIEATPKSGKKWSSTNHGDYDFNWWGGNLRAAGQYPVASTVANKVVYSPHDYGPLVYNQPWFQGSFTPASLRADVWEPNWLYLHDDNTAPLLVGEWGGRLGQDERQDRWMTALRDLIVDEHLAHTFWCLNPNSGDTGGLWLDDWTTWDETKYALLKPALWQDSQGRFVSLDHATPLPGSVSLTEYYAAGGAAPKG